MTTLDQKVALVTGASRGIGRAIALRLARDGASVAVAYHSNHAAADEVVAEAVAAGGSAFTVHAPLGERSDATALWRAFDRRAREVLGSTHVDILVNNAAIARSSDILELTEDEFDRVFAVNVRAPFFIVQQALQRMRDGGRIINISSFVTRVKSPEIIAYAASKGAIDTFTRNLAAELGPRRITANTVNPGAIDTDTNAEWLRSPEGRRYASSFSPLGRVGEPEDVADIVAFLASDDSRWVTGTAVDASGGSGL